MTTATLPATTLTTAEAAKILRVKPSSVRDLARKGRIKKVVNGVWGDPHGPVKALYDRESVLDYRDTRRERKRKSAAKTRSHRAIGKARQPSSLAVEFGKLEGMLSVIDLPQPVLEQFRNVKKTAGFA